MPIDISTPLALPCGATLPNRIAKAGLTEGLANLRNQATEAHCHLYRRWSLGGAGLLLTGNVLIDRSCMERPLNVAVDGNLDDGGRAALAAWARAGTAGGNAFWILARILEPSDLNCRRINGLADFIPFFMKGRFGIRPRPNSWILA